MGETDSAGGEHMIFQLGAGVQRPDGGKVGELHRVVFDPETEAVVSIVVTHNALDGREVVVPIGVVDSADDASVALAASEEQFNTFEDFEFEHNVAPPPDADEVDSDQITDPVDVPDVLPVGAATGVESIAYTPVIEEHVHVPTGDQILDTGTRVWALDGEAGHVSQVWVNDETHQIESFVVVSGTFPKQPRVVPVGVVESIRSEGVTLRVSSGQLQDPYDV
jgi:uncharacterized protein YrrD